MITGAQIRAARALLGWSQRDLADKALLSETAVLKLETAQADSRTSTLMKAREALEKAGIEETQIPGIAQLMNLVLMGASAEAAVRARLAQSQRLSRPWPRLGPGLQNYPTLAKYVALSNKRQTDSRSAAELLIQLIEKALDTAGRGTPDSSKGSR